MKQVIVINRDLKMGKGKIAVQVAHASLLAALESRERYPSKFQKWMESGAKKIVLKASEEELVELWRQARERDIPALLIRDAGLTQVPPGSLTALALGPWEEEELEILTGHLKLL